MTDEVMTVEDLLDALEDAPDDARVAFNSPGFYEPIGDASIRESISRGGDPILELHPPKADGEGGE